MHGETVKIVSK